MSISLRTAEKSDANLIETISDLAYKKFDLDKRGLKYEKASTLNRILTFIEHPDYRVLVCINKSKDIIGFVVAAVYPTLYSDSIKQIVELGMQSDPRLGKVLQSKIMLKLIGAIEKIARDEELDLLAFSICPEFDISSHLEHKGYQLSDKIFIKARCI